MIAVSGEPRSALLKLEDGVSEVAALCQVWVRVLNDLFHETHGVLESLCVFFESVLPPGRNMKVQQALC